jgi:DNA-3-methyladenine glycosylase I
MQRCTWVPEGDPLYVAYHDEEWGIPSHDERHLFEMLVLEGAQAGLSWSTILRKRDAYREAFAGFDVERVARFGPREIERLLAGKTISGTGLKPRSTSARSRSSPVPETVSIVRNRLKIESAIANAQATIEAGGLDELLWAFVGGVPLVNRWRTLAEIPSETNESRAMSKELKRRGFRFVGPTICYALMQACGLVNDHTTDCFRHEEVTRLGRHRGRGRTAV